MADDNGLVLIIVAIIFLIVIAILLYLHFSHPRDCKKDADCSSNKYCGDGKFCVDKCVNPSDCSGSDKICSTEKKCVKAATPAAPATGGSDAPETDGEDITGYTVKTKTYIPGGNDVDGQLIQQLDFDLAKSRCDTTDSCLAFTCNKKKKCDGKTTKAKEDLQDNDDWTTYIKN